MYSHSDSSVSFCMLRSSLMTTGYLGSDIYCKTLILTIIYHYVKRKETYINVDVWPMCVRVICVYSVYWHASDPHGS